MAQRMTTPIRVLTFRAVSRLVCQIGSRMRNRSVVVTASTGTAPIWG